jgi:hypothetical protein
MADDRHHLSRLDRMQPTNSGWSAAFANVPPRRTIAPLQALDRLPRQAAVNPSGNLASSPFGLAGPAGRGCRRGYVQLALVNRHAAIIWESWDRALLPLRMYVELDEAVCLAGRILNVLLMRERGPAGRAVSDPLGFPSSWVLRPPEPEPKLRLWSRLRSGTRGAATSTSPARGPGFGEGGRPARRCLPRTPRSRRQRQT